MTHPLSENQSALPQQEKREAKILGIKEADVSAGHAPKQKWPEFVCSYYHDGSWWGLNITARDWDDAEARVAKLGNLQLEGKLMMTIPAYSQSTWLPSLICRIRNFFYDDR